MRFIYSKIFFWFVVALVLTVLLTFLQTRGLLSPIQRSVLALPRPVLSVARAVALPLRQFIGTIYSIRGLVSDNTELRQRVSSLEEQLVTLGQYKEENEILKRELGFDSVPERQTLPCTVLAQDPEGLTDTAVINCGSANGVRVGQAVMSGGYLIGKTWLVNQTSSTIKLLTRPETAIDAKLSGTEVSGLIKGSFGSGILMDSILQTAKISTGDLVVTAGINESIPRNLLIGQAGQTISGANDLFKKVTVNSPVDFKNLTFVFVLK